MNMLRMKDVIQRTGLSKSQIYLMISRGDFPRQYEIGQNSVCWLEEDVTSWREAVIRKNLAKRGSSKLLRGGR